MILDFKKFKNNLVYVVLLAVLILKAIPHAFGSSGGQKTIGQRSKPHALTVVGLQFGDESKGSITDLLASSVDGVARYNGGNNAGHTIVIRGQEFKLSLVPSGILHQGITCYLGAGTVLNPESLIGEIQNLKNAGIDISPKNLKIDFRIPLILPLHISLEAIEEHSKNLNTTRKGIGPAYEDKAGRRAIRVGDLVNLDYPENRKRLEKRIETLLVHHNALRRGYGKKEIQRKEIMEYLLDYSLKISPYVADVAFELRATQASNKKLLIEGAQSAWLDISYGTYPYVTSSNTFATAAEYHLGIVFQNNYRLGVIKAYTTRVGNGPFPTAINDAIGEKIGKIGKEWGAVTGRKRDCGWLDLVAVKQMAKMNGIHSLALAKADVLDGFENVKVCIGYEIDGVKFDHLPQELSKWMKIKPIYKNFKGWKNTKGIRKFEDLDSNYVRYIKFIENFIELPVDIISTGPGREEKIIRHHPLENT
ncbi:MAG: adenylosuccinate synthase [Alphaproteobacteria bacterium]